MKQIETEMVVTEEADEVDEESPSPDGHRIKSMRSQREKVQKVGQIMTSTTEEKRADGDSTTSKPIDSSSSGIGSPVIEIKLEDVDEASS